MSKDFISSWNLREGALPVIRKSVRLTEGVNSMPLASSILANEDPGSPPISLSVSMSAMKPPSPCARPGTSA